MAWWLWAIGLAAAASFTTNPLVLLLLIGVASVVVMALPLRTSRGGARSGSTSGSGVVIVVLRVLFRIVFGGSYPGTVILDLPEIPLPDWVLASRCSAR